MLAPAPTIHAGQPFRLVSGRTRARIDPVEATPEAPIEFEGPLCRRFELERQHQPGHRIDAGVESRQHLTTPVRIEHHIVVAERDHVTVRREDARVPREVEPSPRLEDIRAPPTRRPCGCRPS
jgi:hypothetical protein